LNCSCIAKDTPTLHINQSTTLLDTNSTRPLVVQTTSVRCILPSDTLELHQKRTRHHSPAGLSAHTTGLAITRTPTDMSSSPLTESDSNPNRFTISDYTYTDDTQPKVAVAPRAAAIRSPLDLGAPIPSRKETNQSQGSARSASGIRPLPRIPSTSTSHEQAEAGPSTSPIIASPSTMSTTYASSPTRTGTSATTKSALSPSSSTYHMRPPTARTLSERTIDRKGKQPENAAGTQTRPGRNGSGGSSHYKLQLHEVSYLESSL
jgi:hypothetical protein